MKKFTIIIKKSGQLMCNKRIWLPLLIISTVLSDHFSKSLVREELAPVTVISPMLYLSGIWNKGISFGMMANNADLIQYATAAIILVLVIILSRTKRTWDALGLSLMIGGAIGNFIDRLEHKAVYDFILFCWHERCFPSFNLADTYISLGSIIVVITSLLSGTAKKKANKHDN